MQAGLGLPCLQMPQEPKSRAGIYIKLPIGSGSCLTSCSTADSSRAFVYVCTKCWLTTKVFRTIDNMRLVYHKF